METKNNNKIIMKYSEYLGIRTLKLKIIHINSLHTKLLRVF